VKSMMPMVSEAMRLSPGLRERREASLFKGGIRNDEG